MSRIRKSLKFALETSNPLPFKQAGDSSRNRQVISPRSQVSSTSVIFRGLRIGGRKFNQKTLSVCVCSSNNKQNENSSKALTLNWNKTNERRIKEKLILPFITTFYKLSPLYYDNSLPAAKFISHLYSAYSYSRPLIHHRPSLSPRIQPALRYHSTSSSHLLQSYITLASATTSLGGPPMSAFSTKILAKFISTMRMNSTSSGEPIEGDQDNLMANVKGNKRIRINACGQLYSELSETKPSLYGSAPKKTGINFEVEYYDSLDLIPAEVQANKHQIKLPVVCLLHGTPGHYKDFSQLIGYLTNKGIRVVAPNFPSYDATYKHSFRHSPRERVDYLLNFFQSIDLNQIDMLIGHSSAVYTMFELLNQILPRKSIAGRSNVKIRSLGLFSTPSYNLPPNLAVTPFRLFTLKLFDYPFLRPLVVALIHLFVKLQGIQNRVDATKIENLLIAASAVGYSDSHNMPDHLKLVKTYQIPTFLLIGCSDKLVPMRCFEQLKRDLGITGSRQVKCYDSQGKLKKSVEEINELVQVSQFESGGHYTFQKHWNEVNQDVYNFLLKVISTSTVDSTKL